MCVKGLMDFFLFSDEKYAIVEEMDLFEIEEFDYIIADNPSDRAWDLIHKKNIEKICRIPESKWNIEKNKIENAEELDKYWEEDGMSITIQIRGRAE